MKISKKKERKYHNIYLLELNEQAGNNHSVEKIDAGKLSPDGVQESMNFV